ncbi:MAG: hypothetical protein ABI583_03400 [Betaproteobacteria bacterium]
MTLNRKLQSRTTWTLRLIGWAIALSIIFVLLYKATFKKQMEKAGNCLDQASSGERTRSPLASVEQYSACVVRKSPAVVDATAQPARCRYAGTWAAARAGQVYDVTLEPDGSFVAEPGQNTPPNASTFTGAWGVAGKTLVWVYDSGPVWPPDINPILNESDKAFTLKEVDGATTSYTLVQRSKASLCRK